MTEGDPQSRPRVGLIGARRARQGLGPFVARWLAKHGADVVAFAGTRPETVAAAGAELARVAGVTARGHVGAEAMLRAEALDAVAILSPPEHHAEGLEACLAAGVHALAEKPLVWPDRAGEATAGASASRAARDFEDRFAARGLVLAENCQWPYVIPSFRRLFPASPAVPERFAMGMEPASLGFEMLADALSHPLSVLQALVGPQISVRAPEVAGASAGATWIDLAFVAEGPRGSVASRVELRHAPEQPRRAWLALDGDRAERSVRLPAYTIHLSDRASARAREVAVPDPLEALIAEFLARIGAARREGPGAPSHALSARIAALEVLVRAAYAASPPSSLVDPRHP